MYIELSFFADLGVLADSDRRCLHLQLLFILQAIYDSFFESIAIYVPLNIFSFYITLSYDCKP